MLDGKSIIGYSKFRDSRVVIDNIVSIIENDFTYLMDIFNNEVSCNIKDDSLIIDIELKSKAGSKIWDDIKYDLITLLDLLKDIIDIRTIFICGELQTGGNYVKRISKKDYDDDISKLDVNSVRKVDISLIKQYSK